MQPATLDLWEAAALRGTGKPLSDLFAGLGYGTDRRFRELDMLEYMQFEAEKFCDAEPEDKHARHHLNRIKKRIDRLKTDLVIDLGRGGLDPID